MCLTKRQKAVFVLVEEGGFSQRDVAGQLRLDESYVSRVLSVVWQKYNDARAICPDVPESQFRKAFLSAN